MLALLRLALLPLLATVIIIGLSETVHAGTAQEIDQDASVALERLYKSDPAAKELAGKAVAILIFPQITKAGLMIGGAYGEGVLRTGGKSLGYYSSVAASYGLQAGAQTFGYAMFFMNKEAVAYLDSSDGWEIGSGPSVVVADDGFSKKMSSTTLSEDVYAFIFNQSGLMAGLGIEGSKISRIDR